MKPEIILCPIQDCEAWIYCKDHPKGCEKCKAESEEAERDGK